MVRVQNYGVGSWATLVILISMTFLVGCSRILPEPVVQTVTKVEKVQVPVVARPKPLQLNDTRVFVVTEENYEQFVEEFKETYGEVAFVALSMKDYELLALNIAEIRRYLDQQKEIIVYYEDAVTSDSKSEKK